MSCIASDFEIDLGNVLANSIAVKSSRTRFNVHLQSNGLYSFESSDYNDGSAWLSLSLY